MSLYDRASNRFARHSIIIACALSCCILAPAASAEGDRRAQALQLYGEGSYEQALPLLEDLDAAGEADGTLLYRLYYCQRQLQRPEARRTQERARLQLEKEVEDSPDLEVPFYLANAYRNIGRLTDMRRVATAAIARMENGELQEPSSGVEMFRLGKLYADLDRENEAAEWYGRAVDLLADQKTDSAPPYAIWAARYLAERAAARGELESAAKYQALLPLDGLEAAELDSLAVASCRAGLFERAREAWLRAERLMPTDANRYRYGRHLASMALSLGGLPDRTADGRAWSELSKEDLQSLITEAVQEVRQTATTANDIYRLMLELITIAAGELDDKVLVNKLDGQLEMILLGMFERMQQEMDSVKPQFVAACLEFTIKNYGIRETSFFGGFAPLVFHENQWRILELFEEPSDDSEAAEEETDSFGEKAKELLTALEEAMVEGPEVAKLRKMIKRVKKKIGK
jgi:tetratricopeptide (TPR) repeat protein